MHEEVTGRKGLRRGREFPHHIEALRREGRGLK